MLAVKVFVSRFNIFILSPAVTSGTAFVVCENSCPVSSITLAIFRYSLALYYTQK